MLGLSVIFPAVQAARINVLEAQLQQTTEDLEDESTHHQADMATIHQKLLHLTSSMQVSMPLQAQLVLGSLHDETLLHGCDPMS